MIHWVKDPALSLLWHRFDLWPGNLGVPQAQPKKKKVEMILAISRPTCAVSRIILFSLCFVEVKGQSRRPGAALRGHSWMGHPNLGITVRRHGHSHLAPEMCPELRDFIPGQWLSARERAEQGPARIQSRRRRCQVAPANVWRLG